jgi:hypothetical protein
MTMSGWALIARCTRVLPQRPLPNKKMGGFMESKGYSV